jgi:hypothetical protein
MNQDSKLIVAVHDALGGCELDVVGLLELAPEHEELAAVPAQRVGHQLRALLQFLREGGADSHT